MGEMNSKDVLEVANGLDNDFETLREDARRRYDLYSLRREPYVPDDIAREGKFEIKSPLLINAAQSIRSDMMMNPTEFTVIPLARDSDGTVPAKAERMAENLERAYAVQWGRMNQGRFIDMETIWHQLVSPFAVWILQFNEFEMPDQPEWMTDEQYVAMVDDAMAKWTPWSIYMPDPMTCSWLLRGDKPVLFARRYKMLVRDIEDSYSKRRGSKEPDKFLRMGSDRKWGWASDDFPRDSSQIKAGFEEVEVVWLDDGYNIYQVCMNPGNDSGEMVWCQPNPTNRVTGFVIPGNITPFRKMEDKYEPFLLPLMQVILQINDLRSTRATAARNLAGPKHYVAVNPELAKIMLQRNIDIPKEVMWRNNEMPNLLGEIKSMPSELTPDWDKLENSINTELQRFLPSQFVHIVDPAVLKAATATSILHAAETGLRIYGPLMAAKDAAVVEVFESIEAAVRMNYQDLKLNVYASGEEMARGTNLTEGAVFSFGFDEINFAHRNMVRTRSMSQAQAAAQFDLALRQWILPDGSKGPMAMEDMIASANFTDVPGQIAKLAKESMLKQLDPWLQQAAMQAARDKIKLDSGIDIPVTPPGMGQPGQQPSGIPSAAQRMDTPFVPGPEGGNLPGMEGQGPVP